MRKKTLYCILIIAMVLSLFLAIPMTASATSAVCEIVGGSTYATLQSAIEAVPNGATIRLLTDITHSSMINVSGKSFTVDVNDYTLTVNPNNATCVYSADGFDISIVDNGISESSGAFNASASGGNSLVGLYAYGNGSSITVNVTATISVTGTNSYGVYAYNGGVVTVAGDISATGSGSIGAYAESSIYGGLITIDGGIDATNYIKINESIFTGPDQSITPTTKPGYLTYKVAGDSANPQSTVWVKEAVLPSSSNASIEGRSIVGATLTGSYDFVAGTYPEGDTAFRWLRVSGTPSLLGQPFLIYTTNNIAGVTNDSAGPPNPTTFTVTGSSVITKISNYHYGSSDTPGTISLQESGGAVYGPWDAVSDGYWCVYPDIELPAGTYTVIDSKANSWSFNAESGNAGMTEIAGYTVITGATEQTYTLQQDDLGKSVIFEVTAEDTMGNTGLASMSSSIGPITEPIELAGDIYVYSGQYTVWNGDSAAWSSSEIWYPLDEAHPISSNGIAINHNLYVIDSTDLYFDNLDLGTGGLYTHADNDGDTVNIEGGTLKAAEIEVCYELWIDTSASVFVAENVTADYEVDSFGCILDIGGNIQAPYVYFDSDDGPLYVTVAGSIYAYEYDQEGGSVTVNGNIDVGFFPTDYYPTEEDWEDDYEIYIETDYADYNFTELNVGGDMTSESLFIWSDDDYYYNEESSDIPIVVNVAGDIEAESLIAIYYGVVNVGGSIRTTDSMQERTIYIYGGKVVAENIDSATAIFIGDSEDYYGINNEIVVDVTGDITAAYEICIYGGSVTAAGTIETTNPISMNPDTIYIYGGKISAAILSSATGIVIGSYMDNYRTNDEILIIVDGGIAAETYIDIYGGTIFAESVSCSDDFFIHDSATLFNAINDEEGTEPYNENNYQLYRTILSGLIPGGLAEITVEYFNYDYTKTFTATADENGQVFVWLVGNSHLGGTAVYLTTEDPVLLAESMYDDPNQIVGGLSFFRYGEFETAAISIDISNLVFGDDWSDAPFDPASWVFTEVYGDPLTFGDEIEGFSTDSLDYQINYYRNGELYPVDVIDMFIAGDYVMTVSTVQDITVGEDTITYLAAGSGRFTVSPAVITVEADDKTATVGGAVPEFTLSISDNTNSDVFEQQFQEDADGLLYASCYGTTDSAGSYPIYVLSEYNHDFYSEYSDYLTAMFDENLFVRDSIQFDFTNGLFTVSKSTPPSGGGSSTPVTYTITATAETGGTITPTGATTAVQYSNKTFTITPNEGYIISDVLIDGVSVGAVTQYTFSSITANHTIAAKFEHDCPSKAFTDVDTSLWYHEGIDYVLLAGLFNGTSATTFEPNADMTRAMLVTVLWRLDGEPNTAAANHFSDVSAGTWYTDAVIWAAENNIVEGYDADTFGPNDPITREQMAAILYRYASYKGYDVSASDSLETFTDLETISNWALTSVKWAVAEGLITGVSETTLDPAGNASRAQVATILMRFVNCME